MKLSVLIGLLRQLEQISVPDMQKANQNQLHSLIQLACHHPVVRFEDRILELESAISGIEQNFDLLRKALDTLTRQLRRQIQLMEPFYLRRSFKQFYHRELQAPHDLSVLSQRLNLPDHVREHLRGSIAKSQDWRWPGLIVRPGHEDWINDLVSLDPLYLVDRHQEWLKPALDRFSVQYQQRLCCYQITEQPGQPILAALPQSQMGLCLLFYYFNFRPLEIIQQWLSDLWLVTRPGGRVLFTYNDCDQAHGVALYESGFMSYTPGHVIRDHAQSLGFEIVEDYHPTDDVSWMELVKPGQLTSCRGAQTLAKVVARSK